MLFGFKKSQDYLKINVTIFSRLNSWFLIPGVGSSIAFYCSVACQGRSFLPLLFTSTYCTKIKNNAPHPSYSFTWGSSFSVKTVIFCSEDSLVECCKLSRGCGASTSRKRKSKIWHAFCLNNLSFVIQIKREKLHYINLKRQFPFKSKLFIEWRSMFGSLARNSGAISSSFLLFIFVCVCILIHTYMCTYICVCVYICVYVCIYLHINII